MKRLTNIEMERITIGILLQRNKLFGNTMNMISFKDFYNKKCSSTFKIINYFYVNDKPFDPAIIEDFASSHKLDIDNDFLYGCISSVPNMENIDYYIQRIFEYSRERQILTLTEQYRLGKIPANKLIEGINALPIYNKTKEETNKDLIMKIIEDAKRGMDINFPEEFQSINDLVGGVDKGDLIVIGGYSGTGKSSLMTALTSGFLRNSEKVLVCSLEMNSRANMRRILANTQKINTMDFRKKNLSEENIKKIKGSIDILQNIYKYKCARVYTMEDIVREVNDFQPTICFIDYLQNISDSNTKLSDYARVTKHTSQIQQLTQSKLITTFLISQFNRPYDRKTVARPRNHNLRDSGAIEERADMILLLWWERKQKMESLRRFDGDRPEKIDIDVTKSKDGATDRLTWNVYPEYHRWRDPKEDLDKDGTPIEPILYEKAEEKAEKIKTRSYRDE